VRSDIHPPPLSRRGVTQAQRDQPVEATYQNPDAQTPAPLSPIVEQPQPGVPQQPDPQGGPQFLPPTQFYIWSPLGGSPMIIPLQPSVHGAQPALPQQPLIFTPYGYFPLVSSPYGNQMFSPYGFSMIPGSPLPQTLANQPPNSPALPAETPSGAALSGNTFQPMQQQQNSELGSLSSEELELAAKMGQLGVYLPTVLTNPSAGAVQPVNQAAAPTNPPAGAVQPVNQAAGLKNPEQQGTVSTAGTLSTRVPQTRGPACSGPRTNTDRVPEGLEGPAQVTVQTPVHPKHKATQGNHV
ncbi:hypothetical protein L3Q82_019720, partial [Scortum barcoo]